MQSPTSTPSGSRNPRFRRSAKAVTALTIALALVPAPASADEIGQAPTPSNITGSGSFSTTSSTITGQSGFGGGTVYYPTASGKYPVVAMVPGFLSDWSSISWLGPRVASWGFVVVGANTNSGLDDPTSRGDQLLAALNWAVNSSPTAVRGKTDGTRRGVAGWSMGGGGTLEALAKDTSGVVKAGVPLAPWHNDKSWNQVNEPVFLIGGENDGVASPDSHAIPFYNSLGGPKSFLERAGANHFFPNSSDPTVSRAVVSFLKRHVSADNRFSPYVCGFSGSAVSDFRSNSC
ncbi:S9 family peptidase [Amycolatopsis sp. YIM 10]|uniref:alpha/beta hydrolase family protein n=1 Tax=Amycolatopsis sp. YIM 10 TaxID=2653857 RepID=UPI0012A85C01|nr:alpha/beta hydrolase [Amycolatopsis sp. YIM 10]QFU91894.1 Lipase 1 [Amycolatopsis sp. YIM 10]